MSFLFARLLIAIIANHLLSRKSNISPVQAFVNLANQVAAPAETVEAAGFEPAETGLEVIDKIVLELLEQVGVVGVP